jgi:hypothetical protein
MHDLALSGLAYQLREHGRESRLRIAHELPRVGEIEALRRP